jgi:hypothetical protein
MLAERAPTEFSVGAAILVEFILANASVVELRNKRGACYDDTKFYQIRVKSSDKSVEKETVLKVIEKLLKSVKAVKMGINDVQINPRSRNSGKYSSISFDFNNKDYDIVIAQGANKGEDFEGDMLLKMDNLVAGIEGSEQAQAAFAALAEIDDCFAFDNIAGVSKRSGSTQRAKGVSIEEMGKIIADIIIELKNGDKKNISLKNKTGATVANIGVGKAFNPDLTVNTKSDNWIEWLAPFKLDPARITAGLQAYESQSEIETPDSDTVEKKITKSSPVFKIMQKLWGSDYYYLREKGKSFVALKIDREYVDNQLLKNLKITEIRYPYMGRKQISIYLESATKKFSIEIRNSAGNIKPSEMKFRVMRDIT